MDTFTWATFAIMAAMLIVLIFFTIFFSLGFFILGYYMGFRSGKGESPFELSDGFRKELRHIEKRTDKITKGRRGGKKV